MSLVGITIPELPNALALQGDESLQVVQQGQSRRTTVGNIANLAGSSLFISAAQFGATGDGSTDDTAALQEFFTYMGYTGGYGIIPAGRYRITAQILVTNTQAYQVSGQGQGVTTIFVDSTNAFSALRFDFPVDVTLADFTVDVRNGTRPSITNHGISINSGIRTYCDRLEILNHGGSAILAFVSTYATYHEVIYTNCLCDGDRANNGNLAGNGFLIEGHDKSGLTDCHAYNCKGNPGITPGIGLQLKNQGLGCWISGGTAVNCLTGIACGFDGAGGITVGMTDAVLSDLIIIGCATGLGIYATNGVQADNVLIDMQNAVGTGAGVTFFNAATNSTVTNLVVLDSIYFQGAVRFRGNSSNNYVEINLHRADSGGASKPTAAIFDAGSGGNSVRAKYLAYNHNPTVASQSVIDNSGVATNTVQLGTLYYQPQTGFDFNTGALLAASTTLTGALTAKSGSITDAAGTNRQIDFSTSGSLRWILRVNTTAETGSNAGSDMVLLNRDDTGAALGQVFGITRATAVLNFNVPPTILTRAVMQTGSGTTAQRYTGLTAADRGRVSYFDTTLGYLITWNGAAWVNGSGAVV